MIDDHWHPPTPDERAATIARLRWEQEEQFEQVHYYENHPLTDEQRKAVWDRLARRATIDIALSPEMIVIYIFSALIFAGFVYFVTVRP